MTTPDIRDTPLFHEAEALHQRFRHPGSGQISDAFEIHSSPDGRRAVFTGVLMDVLQGAPTTRICCVDLGSGDNRVMTFGPNADRLPKYSPDGRRVAFLSDRRKAGDFQLYLLDLVTGAAHATASVDGWVEYFHWSPNGQRILLGVAGHGADISGGQGAVTSRHAESALPSWTPKVETGEESFRWRRAWLYEPSTNRVRPVGPVDTNIWEAVWCGNDSIAAVTSPGPGEGMWYSARLTVIDIATGTPSELYRPETQLGWPAASPSGKTLAVVEGISSDRWIVAGELRLIDLTSRKVEPIATNGVDVTYTEWRSDRHLLVAGHRQFETVVGLYDASSHTYRDVWVSSDLTTGGRYITVSGFGETGDCTLVGESFERAPEIGVIREHTYSTVKSFDLGYSAQAQAVIGAVEPTTWSARDGLRIQGWLLHPRATAPYPTIMIVHGGPVWHSRPIWLARASVFVLMLLKRGYAIFYPNPRGSTGWGQNFVRPVYGDMGGADAQDLLAGLDFLIEHGIADPKRLGITGASYGGFMTSWLITQDRRFAAAVPVAPHTNQVSEHLVSNIPHFMSLILADRYDNPGGKYFQRSPIMHARQVRTPTLNICGALDRCTPPEEAIQFHNALLEHGAKSVLLMYPEEGHGIRKFPAAIDFAARVVGWFEQYV